MGTNALEIAEFKFEIQNLKKILREQENFIVTLMQTQREYMYRYQQLMLSVRTSTPQTDKEDASNA